MQLKCPVCGEVLEVAVDLVDGQRVSCDACESAFNFRKEYAIVESRRSHFLSRTCPHCGRKHTVEETKLGKFVTC